MTHREKALKREVYMRSVCRGLALTNQKGYLGYSIRPKPRRSKAEGRTTPFQVAIIA